MGHIPDLASSRVYRVNDITLNCVEVGPEEGPLLILLHGFPEFWWGWRAQIGPLARAGFRVLVPDQRGYNLSDKPNGKAAYELDILACDVIGLAEACGRKTFSIVGHDWGGIVAWHTATNFPDRVERMVAINAPHPSVIGPYLRSHPAQMLRSSYALFFRIPGLPEAMLSADKFQALKRSLLRTSRPGTFSETDLGSYEEAWSKPGAITAMLNWYRAIPFASWKSVKKPLALPALILWGMRDSFMESGIADASLGLCEKGELLRFDNATHWLPHEEPASVSEALIAFLRPAVR